MRKLCFEMLELRLYFNAARPVLLDALVSSKPLPSNPARILNHVDTTPDGKGYESLGIIKFENPSDLSTTNQTLGYDYSNRQVHVVTHIIRDGSREGIAPNSTAWDFVERDFDTANQVYAHAGITVVQTEYKGKTTSSGNMPDNRERRRYCRLAPWRRQWRWDRRRARLRPDREQLWPGHRRRSLLEVVNFAAHVAVFRRPRCRITIRPMRSSELPSGFWLAASLPDASLRRV
jgi:hypothetical protein